MKYLITGSQGQLGSELRSQLDDRQLEGRDVTYVVVDIEECDITDETAVARLFEDHPETDVVFHTAAYTAVDRAEDEPQKAYAVNAMGAANIAAASREIGAKLVHFSTDFVFGDGDGTPRDERAEPEPLSVYGASKLAGETLALQNNPSTAVLRTCGLYSRWGGNFINSIAAHGRDKEKLEVVNDQYVGPTPVSTLAEVALAMTDTPLFVGGLHHATVGGECTWYEFACEIVEQLGIDTRVEPTTSRAWGAPARRSRYSVLDNRRLRLRGLDLFDDWRTELQAFLDDHGDDL